jgi:hypothetical protein
MLLAPRLQELAEFIAKGLRLCHQSCFAVYAEECAELVGKVVEELTRGLVSLVFSVEVLAPRLVEHQRDRDENRAGSWIVESGVLHAVEEQFARLPVLLNTLA